MTATSTPTADVNDSAGDPVGLVDALKFPTKRDEAWRYAPHALLGRLSFGLPNAPIGHLPQEVERQIPVLGGPMIVISNGVVDTKRSDLGSLPAGLQFLSRVDASSEQPELLGDDGDHDRSHCSDAYASLNQAFAHNGAVVRVARDHAIAVPIHIVHISLSDDTGRTSCSRVSVHLDHGASATVVETSIGNGGFGGSNTRTTITLASNATLDHIMLQDVAATQVHLGRIEVNQSHQSVFRSHLFNLGGAYGRFAYDVNLMGEGASAVLSGLYFGQGQQVHDQQINVVHAAANCRSRQSFRGVLDEQSTGVFNGGIDVRPGADGTDAVQSNQNLLLSDRAEANTQPRLEILADDVTCKHGATVGQLDDDALYYLRTRGISGTEARRLLIDGFANDAVNEVDNETVRAWLTKRVGHNDA